MPATCFSCGDTGHVVSECPNETYVHGTGDGWCGTCDQRTRLISLDEDQTRMMRCSVCHPKRGQRLAQYRKCGSCQEVIYEWDAMACGKHAEVGEHREVAGWESSPQPLVNEPAELEGATVDLLARELRKLREMDMAPASLPSPERDIALRELAARQVAESRARRIVRK